MGIQFLVKTTFEDGSIQRRDIGRLARTPDNLATESPGLRHVEAKDILKRLQEVVLQDQIDEALEARRKCNDCGKPRAIHDDRGRIVDTLYGRFRLNATRIRQCVCKAIGGVLSQIFLRFE